MGKEHKRMQNYLAARMQGVKKVSKYGLIMYKLTAHGSLIYKNCKSFKP